MNELSSSTHAERSIGLAGAVVTLIGFMIGASIFILPGQLAATAGPAVIISYLIAGALALFSCLVAAQLGSIYDRSGASYHIIRELISPLTGFTAIWSLIGAASLAVALVAMGFADYMAAFTPEVEKSLIAVAIIALFCIVNLVGAHASVVSQSVMVFIFGAALILFVVAGLRQLDPALLTPFMPNGMGTVLSATIPAFFSWAGFTMLIELGGEIKQPHRNIPLALAISFILVLLCYCGVCLALVGTLSWEELGNYTTPLAEAGARLLPPWLAQFITLSALLAAATSINSLILAFSRDLYAMAKQGALPRGLAKLTGQHAIPGRAVILISLVSIAIVLAGGSIVDYAMMIVMVLMVIQILLAIATWRIPSLQQHQYNTASFRLPLPVLYFSCAAMILASLMFLTIGAIDSPRNALVMLLIFASGAGFYSVRQKMMQPGRANPPSDAGASH